MESAVIQGFPDYQEFRWHKDHLSSFIHQSGDAPEPNINNVKTHIVNSINDDAALKGKTVVLTAVARAPAGSWPIFMSLPIYIFLITEINKCTNT